MGPSSLCRALFLLLLFPLVSASSAQTGAVMDRPPSIVFFDWKEVARPEGAVEYSAVFPSSLTSGYVENDLVPLRVFLPDTRNEPVRAVLITHYWGATDLRAERSLAMDLVRSGMGAVILTLPYHLGRTPAGHRSGDMAIPADVPKLRETMTQAVLDVRRAIDFMDSRPEFIHEHYGLMGTSLGAIVASLGYAVEPRVSSAAFVLGGADLAHIIWASSRVVRQRDVLRRQGVSERSLTMELASVEPLTYLPRRDSAPSLVVQGRYDTVVPHESSEELIAALKDPAVIRLQTGHYGGIFVERKILREVARFFEDQAVAKKYVPPATLVAPTIRIGALASAPGGLDLGVGLDLVRDTRADRYITLFVTPRGPQVFGGLHVLEGIHVGVVGSTHRVGVALLWSTVL